MQFPISTGFYENQWPATLDWHLVFYKIICRMRFTSAVWCWQHRDCVYKAAGSVLSHVHQFHTAVAPIATFSWLSSIHQKAVQFSHGLDAYLKAKIALCSACNIAFKTPVLFFLAPLYWVCASRAWMQPLRPFWKHTEVLCQGCGWCADSELMAAHPLRTPHGKGYCYHCSFTGSNCCPSRMAGSSQFHRKGASLSLPTPLMCLCEIATKCLQKFSKIECICSHTQL